MLQVAALMWRLRTFPMEVPLPHPLIYLLLPPVVSTATYKQTSYKPALSSPWIRFYLAVLFRKTCQPSGTLYSFGSHVSECYRFCDSCIGLKMLACDNGAPDHGSHP